MEASSTRVTQSHITLPCGVCTTSARWPMAICGRVSTATRPGSSSETWFCRPSAMKSASVAHCWPFQPTYWRSSSQIGQRAGGCSLGAYCTPQVRQMKASIVSPRLRHSHAGLGSAGEPAGSPLLGKRHGIYRLTACGRGALHAPG